MAIWESYCLRDRSKTTWGERGLGSTLTDREGLAAENGKGYFEVGSWLSRLWWLWSGKGTLSSWGWRPEKSGVLVLKGRLYSEGISVHVDTSPESLTSSVSWDIISSFPISCGLVASHGSLPGNPIYQLVALHAFPTSWCLQSHNSLFSRLVRKGVVLGKGEIWNQTDRRSGFPFYFCRRLAVSKLLRTHCLCFCICERRLGLMLSKMTSRMKFRLWKFWEWKPFFN